MNHSATNTGDGIDDQFVRELTKIQNRLYAYIFSLLPDADWAQDVLQETNVILWKKACNFTKGTNFGAWATKIAYYEVLAARRKMHRDRLQFNETVLQELATAAWDATGRLDEKSVALDECLQKLSSKQRERLLNRYQPGGSIRDIAEATGATPGAVAMALSRIRLTLLECIEGKIKRGVT